MSDLWTWSETIVIIVPENGQESGRGEAARNPLAGTDVTGWDVHTTDGHIGKVDRATYETGGSYLVVDTGFWIFGKKRMIPAGVVERVDDESRTIHVSLTKEQVKQAPDYEAERSDESARSDADDYYKMSSARR